MDPKEPISVCLNPTECLFRSCECYQQSQKTFDPDLRRKLLWLAAKWCELATRLEAVDRSKLH